MALVRCHQRSLAGDLNRRHGRGYPAEYWRCLTRGWLVNLASIAWRRFAEAEAAKDTFGGQSLSVSLAPAAVAWGFRDFYDLLNRGLMSTEFSWWLTSLAIRKLRPADWTLDESETLAIAANDGDAIVPPVAHRPVKRIGGLKFPARLVLSVAAELLARSIPTSASVEAIEPRTRDINAIDLPPEFKGMFADVVAQTMPRFLEGAFVRFETAAKAGSYRRGRIFLARPEGFQHETCEMFELAHAVLAGERIVSHQHGAGYGYAAMMPSYAEGEYTHSAFLSWGWRSHGVYIRDAIPVPTPLLPIPRRGPGRCDGKLLFVGTPMIGTGYRVNSDPGFEGALRYRRAKVAFVRALEATPRAELLYRAGRGVDCLLEDAEFLERHAGPVELLLGELNEQLRTARIVVADYPWTIFPQCLANDIPIIATWDPEIWPFTEEPKALMADLKTAGLLHDTAESAASHINAIWGNVDQWWTSEQTRSARDAWLKFNGRTSRFWLLHWLSAFAKVMRRPVRNLWPIEAEPVVRQALARIPGGNAV